jgi:hypothetical protein
MSARVVLITGITVAALLAGVAGAVGMLRSGAPSPEQGKGSTGISETVRPGPRASPGGAADYWTPERMRSAAPAPMPEGRHP